MSFTITPAQYEAALLALDLDPRLVVNVGLASGYVTVTKVRTDETGYPVLRYGAVVTDTESQMVVEPSEETEPEDDPDADPEGDPAE